MEEKKKNIWLVILKVVLIYAFFEILTSVLGSILASSIYSSMLYGKYTIYAVSEFVILLCALALLFIRKKWYIFKVSKTSFKDSVKLTLPIVIISVIVLFFNSIDMLGSKINYNNLVSLIFYAILIGLFEEIFFRGIIENELLESFSDNKKQILTSIILSGMIFGGVHLTNLFVGQDLLTTMMQFVQTTAIGILFGTIYYKTKNIWALVFLHSFYDLAVFLSSSNLILDCGYAENVPISITVFSMVGSLILSLVYIVYAFSLLESSKGKLYNTVLCFLIALFFINNTMFGLFGANNEEYYICPSYSEVKLKNMETHYYNYNDFYYTLEDGTVYHIYKKSSSAILEDNIGNKTIFDIKSVNSLVVIDNYLLVVESDVANDILYVKDLNNLDNDFTTYKVPFINSIGYLYDKDNNIKYPLVKSYINDLFIIDNNEVKLVEED